MQFKIKSNEPAKSKQPTIVIQWYCVEIQTEKKNKTEYIIKIIMKNKWMEWIEMRWK